MYIVKINFTMPYIDNNIKNAKMNLHKIANFCKFSKMYTQENIYVHSIRLIHLNLLVIQMFANVRLIS